MPSPQRSDDGVWLRVYLAVLGWLLVAVGMLALAGWTPGGLLGVPWSLSPLVGGLLALIAAAVGLRLTLVVMRTIGVGFMVTGCWWLATFWTPGGIDSVVAFPAAMSAAGAASLWLPYAWLRSGRLLAVRTAAAGTSRELWWQTRWWLLVVAMGLPFVVGLTATGVAVLTSDPEPSGCGEAGGRLLESGARSLAGRIGGMHLYETSGCDSGDSAMIDWRHSDLTAFVAAAKVAGCRDAYLDEWDGDWRIMLCGEGASTLLIAFNSDGTGAQGSIQLHG